MSSCCCCFDADDDDSGDDDSDDEDDVQATDNRVPFAAALGLPTPLCLKTVDNGFAPPTAIYHVYRTDSRKSSSTRKRRNSITAILLEFRRPETKSNSLDRNEIDTIAMC